MEIDRPNLMVRWRGDLGVVVGFTPLEEGYPVLCEVAWCTGRLGDKPSYVRRDELSVVEPTEATLSLVHQMDRRAVVETALLVGMDVVSLLASLDNDTPLGC